MRVQVLGYRGLALGTSIAALFNAFALLVLLHRRLDRLDVDRLLVAFFKITVAATIMGAGAFGVHEWLTSVWAGDGTVTQLVRLLTSIAVALILLVGSARVLRIRELDHAQRQLLKRFGRA